MPKPNLRIAAVIAMCSLPVPETKLSAISVPDNLPCSLSIISSRNTSIAFALSTIIFSCSCVEEKFSLPNSLVITNTLFQSPSVINLPTWPHVPLPVDKHATRFIPGMILFLYKRIIVIKGLFLK